MKPKSKLSNFLLGTTLLAATPALHAASATWNGTTDATWATGTNWSATPVPGTGDTATFNNAGGAVDTIDLGAGVTVRDILFDTSSAAAYTIGSGAVGSQAVTINNSGGITVSSTVTNSQLFNANVNLGNATATTQTFTNNSTTATLTFAGTVVGGTGGTSAAKTLFIDGAGNIIISGAVQTGGASSLALTKNGTGTLTLSGANTYTGATTINNGTLKLGANNVLADASAITVGGLATNGILDLNGFSDTTTAVLGLGRNDNSVAGLTHSIVNTGSSSAVLTVGPGSGSGTGVIYRAGASGKDNGQATISANLGLNSGASNVTFDIINNSNAVEVFVSGTISGTSNTTLTKGNSGALRLTGANTYRGQTLINNGILEVNTLANAGSASSVGYGDAVAGSDVIRIGNSTLTSTLNYIGNGSSSNRRIQVGAGTTAGDTGGAIVLNNGDGALVFTNAAFNASNTGAIAARTLTLGGSNTDANTIQGAIVNNGATGTVAVNVTKQDSGTWILGGTNTYTGATSVNAGTLIINGSTSSTSIVTVAAGATLGGSGTVGGNTTISGTHNPGNSPGIQTFSSNLSYVNDGTPDPTVNWELTGNTSTNLANPNAIFDQIIVGGNLDFADLTTINLVFNGVGSNVLWADTFWGSSQSWLLYDVAGTTSNFGNLSLNTIDWLDSGGNLFSTTGGSFALTQSGHDVVLSYTAVPEPRAALLGGLGLLALLRRRRD